MSCPRPAPLGRGQAVPVASSGTRLGAPLARYLSLHGRAAPGGIRRYRPGVVRPLDPTDRFDLQRLAAALVLDDDFRPEVAVAKAANLVAKGVDGPATSNWLPSLRTPDDSVAWKSSAYSAPWPQKSACPSRRATKQAGSGSSGSLSSWSQERSRRRWGEPTVDPVASLRGWCRAHVDAAATRRWGSFGGVGARGSGA